MVNLICSLFIGSLQEGLDHSTNGGEQNHLVWWWQHIQAVTSRKGCHHPFTKKDITPCLLYQVMNTGGAITREVIKTYIEGGLVASASNQIAPAQQGMVSGQISTALLVPASQPPISMPTRLGAANRALHLINEAIGIRGDDGVDTAGALVAPKDEA